MALVVAVIAVLALRSFMGGRMLATPSAPGDKALIIDLNPALYQYPGASSISGGPR